MFNQEFLEGADIVPAFVPVDMSLGANAGDWINLRNYDRCVAVFLCSVGTAGDDPVITVQQATAADGSGGKDLEFTRIRYKVGATAISDVGQWTLETQSASAQYDTSVINAAENEALVAVEFQADQLDITGGFTYAQLSVADVGSNSQLGCAFYLLYGARYKRSIKESAIA